MGTMVIKETGGRVEGRLEVMNRKNSFSGRLSADGTLTISGTVKTLISTVYYTAAGTVSGSKILLNLKTAPGAYYPVSGEEFNTDDEIL